MMKALVNTALDNMVKHKKARLSVHSNQYVHSQMSAWWVGVGTLLEGVILSQVCSSYELIITGCAYLTALFDLECNVVAMCYS